MQHALGRLEDAADSFEKAAALAPNPAEARCARATVLAALGKLDEAQSELHLALAQAPDHPQAHHNLGVLLAQRGDHAGALAQYDRVLLRDPRHTGARENRASLRLARGDAQGALEDYQALCANPGTPIAARAGLVRALLLLHRDAEALDEAERLLGLYPNDRLAKELKAIALASVGRVAEAQGIFGGPQGAAKARSAFIDRALERQKVCDWRDRERLVLVLREALAQPGPDELRDEAVLFHAHALPLRGAELKAISSRVSESIRRKAGSLGKRTAGPAAKAGRRLRVGFMSSGMREHPEARLLRRVLLDRDRDRFEYLVYALNADDGSTFRAAIVQSADRFVDASAWTTARIVDRMRGDKLDLLVDLSGNLAGARPEVLAARVAPLQANFIGPPCTLGPGLLDYRLSDAVATPPEHQRDWHERLVLLPVPHWTYDSDQPVGEPGGREAYGLPRGAFVYCAFHQAFKINPKIFSVWMRLLLRTPDSVLWLLDGGPLVRANLAAQAREAGIDPTRLVFTIPVPLELHLGRQRHADLFLDTLHYGAQTTAADALHVGLPIVSCPGDTMASRLCASLMHGAGIAELLASSLEEYEGKALELAGSPSLLAAKRENLRHARHAAPFFATRERVRALERAFEAMIERQRTGLPPDTLNVS